MSNLTLSGFSKELEGKEAARYLAQNPIFELLRSSTSQVQDARILSYSSELKCQIVVQAVGKNAAD